MLGQAAASAAGSEVPRVSFRVFRGALDVVASSRVDAGVPLPPAVFAGLNPTQVSELQAAFRALGLVDDAGAPTLRLLRLAPAEGRPAELGRLVKRFYGSALPVLRSGADNGEVEDHLVAVLGASPKTADKARRFLVAAVGDAKMDVPPPTPRPRGAKPRAPRAPSSGAEERRRLAVEWIRHLLRVAAERDTNGRYDRELHAQIERALRDLLR